VPPASCLPGILPDRLGILLFPGKLLPGLNILSGASLVLQNFKAFPADLSSDVMFKKYSLLQIASLNGHLCHIRRPACDLNGGHPRTH